MGAIYQPKFWNVKLLKKFKGETEGVQNRPLEDVSLWHVNYFELKAFETLLAPRKLWEP